MKIAFSMRKFSLITIFTLVNSFVCFFYKKLITLLVSKPHMKRPVAAPALLIHSSFLFMIDRTTAQIEVVMKS